MIHHNKEYAGLLSIYEGGAQTKRKDIPVMPPLRWNNTVTR